MGVVKHLFDSGIGVWLVGVIPVGVGEAPEYAFIAEVVYYLQGLLAVSSLGKAKVFCHCDAGFFKAKRLERGEVFGYLVGSHTADVFVIFRMVADEVALAVHSCNQIRIAEYNVIKYEKGGTHALVTEGVENFCGVAVFITEVKGEIKHPFVTCFVDASIYGIAVIARYKRFCIRYGRLVVSVALTAPMQLTLMGKCGN